MFVGWCSSVNSIIPVNFLHVRSDLILLLWRFSCPLQTVSYVLAIVLLAHWSVDPPYSFFYPAQLFKQNSFLALLIFVDWFSSLSYHRKLQAYSRNWYRSWSHVWVIITGACECVKSTPYTMHTQGTQENIFSKMTMKTASVKSESVLIMHTFVRNAGATCCDYVCLCVAVKKIQVCFFYCRPCLLLTEASIQLRCPRWSRWCCETKRRETKAQVTDKHFLLCTLDWSQCIFSFEKMIM